MNSRRGTVASAALAALMVSVATPSTVGVASAQAPATVESLKQTKLDPPEPAEHNMFGASTAIDGDTAVVGEPGGFGNPGAAWVYVKQGGAWLLQAKLSDPEGRSGDEFGSAVAIEGDTIVVGASGMDQRRGKAYVYTRSGSTWTEQAQLQTSDAQPGYISDFGAEVAIDGDTVVVAAIYIDLRDDDRRTFSGAVYVYVGAGSSWTQQARLVSDDRLGDQLGRGLAIDGDTVAAGAARDDNPGVSTAGAVYIFVRNGTTWTRQKKLLAPDPEVMGGFGYRLDLDANTLVATASGSRQDRVYVFVRTGAAWSQQAELRPTTPNGYFAVGGVAVLGSLALVGDPVADGPGCYACGVTYAFTRSGSNWSPKKVIVPAGGVVGSGFGNAIAFDGQNAVIGADSTPVPGDPEEDYAGAAFIVEKQRVTGEASRYGRQAKR